jgi:D-3-phosphoglycerate dehydrogenase
MVRRSAAIEGVSVSDQPWNVLALPPLHPDLLAAFLAPLGEAVRLTLPASRDRAGLHTGLADAEIVLGDFTGQLPLDAAAVAVAPQLAFVQQVAVGVDGHDLAALAAAGVPLANTAGANTISVAEWCLAATFTLLRSAVWADQQVRSGGWPQLELGGRSSELAGKRVGLVGFGAIGTACATRYAALGCDVSYWTRRRRSPGEEHGATYRELDDLVATSDVLVVVVALAPETTGLLGAERLGRLPHGAHLVNAARGGIVDEAALLALLDSGQLAGAALDVYSTEPPAVDDPVRAHPKLLLSPHAAAVTPQAQLRLLQATLANVTAAIEGRPVVNVVNGADPVVRRR